MSLLSVVADVFNANPGTEGEWDFYDSSFSGRADIGSILQPVLQAIEDKYKGF